MSIDRFFVAFRFFLHNSRFLQQTKLKTTNNQSILLGRGLVLTRARIRPIAGTRRPVLRQHHRLHLRSNVVVHHVRILYLTVLLQLETRHTGFTPPPLGCPTLTHSSTLCPPPYLANMLANPLTYEIKYKKFLIFSQNFSNPKAPPPVGASHDQGSPGSGLLPVKILLATAPAKTAAAATFGTAATRRCSRWSLASTAPAKIRSCKCRRRPATPGCSNREPDDSRRPPLAVPNRGAVSPLKFNQIFKSNLKRSINFYPKFSYRSISFDLIFIPKFYPTIRKKNRSKPRDPKSVRRTDRNFVSLVGNCGPKMVWNLKSSHGPTQPKLKSTLNPAEI